MAGLLTFPISEHLPILPCKTVAADFRNTMQKDCIGITATGIVPDLHRYSLLTELYQTITLTIISASLL